MLPADRTPAMDHLTEGSPKRTARPRLAVEQCGALAVLARTRRRILELDLSLAPVPCDLHCRQPIRSIMVVADEGNRCDDCSDRSERETDWKLGCDAYVIGDPKIRVLPFASDSVGLTIVPVLQPAADAVIDQSGVDAALQKGTLSRRCSWARRCFLFSVTRAPRPDQDPSSASRLARHRLDTRCASD
jgi:hypothetical protein